MLGKDGDVQRVLRNRHSLAIFDRWQLKLPYFVMYRFPSAFADSKLCWRGLVLWEGAADAFQSIENKEFACRALTSQDIGRRIFGVSIGPDAQLAMRLDGNADVTARRSLAAAIPLIGVIGILALLVHWRPRRMILPMVLGSLTLLLVIGADATFLGGYRPFDGGDDGLIFSGWAREMLQHLVTGDIAGALRGVEPVFYFNPGMRYFRAVEFLLFGDTYLLYLLLVLIMPLVVQAVFVRFTGAAWGFALTLVFVAIPLGALFGTTYAHYVSWAARGYADTLGALAFFAGLVLIAGRPGGWVERMAPAFWGAVLMAAAVILRPNLALAVGALMGGVGLILLWRRRLATLAALCLGFCVIGLTGFHNWYFGGVFVPISGNAGAPNVFMVSPSDYVAALGELVRLDLGGDHLTRAAKQIVTLLSGPAELWPLIPLHIAAYAIVVCVICSRRFEPMIRLTALAVIGLVPVGLIYAVAVRYNLVMWFLMSVIAAAWLQTEGLSLISRTWPASCRLADNTVVLRLGRTVERLRAATSA